MTAAFARKPLGGSNVRRVESYQPRVAEISALEKEHETLSDAALRARSEEFKTQLADSRRRDEHDKHNLATGVRAQMKSASLAVRPPAKGSEG